MSPVIMQGGGDDELVGYNIKRKSSGLHDLVFVYSISTYLISVSE